MKVLLINGSSHRNGSTYTALEEVAIALRKEDIETEFFQLGNPEIRYCSGCKACRQIGKCVYDDIVNVFVEKAGEFDGFVFGTPVYYAHPSGRILSFIDRAFYSGSSAFAYKPAAAIASARRSGTTASFDVLNKYFTIAGMPVASGDYWNNGFGLAPGEIEEDKEGLRNARVVAKRMVFLMNAIKDAKEKYPDLLVEEDRVSTHFIKNK